jgi:formylglycine-generating enzyme required for sulfatase activity
MTLLRINPGEFVRKDPASGAKDQRVQLTRSFFLSDRETSVGQFQQFISDANYPNEEKPQEEWPGAEKLHSPTPDHPVQRVTWYDAALFCNWLSRKEGLTPCYVRTANASTSQYGEHDAWRLVADAAGYRLPTDEEWEYSCRAGTTTEFPSGNDEEMLRRYAVIQSSRTAAGGSKLPNGWGLFDMHGNVWEWCTDGFQKLAVPVRVVRGGSWNFTAEGRQFSFRDGLPPASRFNYLGFRVARGGSGR